MEKESLFIVDDDEDLCRMLGDTLRPTGLDVQWATSGQAALQTLKTLPVDVVLTDLHLPDMDGIGLCAALRAHRPDIPSIVITAFGSMESAVEAMRAGAYDFVTKPVDTDLLLLVVRRALKHRRMTEKIRLLEQAPPTVSPGGLLGESPAMQTLFSRMERVAGSDASVLITGETGTGKELVARALHDRSPWSKGPFIALNCAAIPEALLESELFGHVQGAFTDARRDHTGLMLQAHGGTLFLDEIAELPLPLQAKLLRALETRKLRRLGDAREIAFDVRLVSATNRNLEALAAEGRFRQDLFYRIHVIGLEIPPLRDRGTDILLLADVFLRQIAEKNSKPVTAFARNAAEQLLTYTWPGNVRELRNAVEHAVALARHDYLTLDDLPESIRLRPHAEASSAGSQEPWLPLETHVEMYVRRVLEHTGQNRTQAAKILGVDRKTLYRHLKNN